MSGEKKGKTGIPGEILDQLYSADARHGFPKGTMASIMQQEVGGNSGAYLTDPGKYHYAAGADGRRVAPHTGKVSSAFGPFGILESTGADPGYGVQPLKGKDLPEQIRFASDYLAARSKASGGLVGGLAGYGEGAKYASQVASRIPGSTAAVAPAPVMAAAQPAVQQVAMTQAAPPPQVAGTGLVELPPELLAHRTGAASPQAAAQADAWAQFLKSMPAAQQVAMQPADISYGPRPMDIRPPVMERAPGAATPNFAAFSSWKNKRA